MGEPLYLGGIIPATVLPMGSDYRMDEKSLRSYMRWIVEQGIVALAINVDTGEGPHLYREERKEVIQVVADEIRGRVPIIAGLSASFTHQAVELARDAREAGADALLVFPIQAFHGKPLPLEVPYLYHRSIAEASGLPIVFFQLTPELGGVEYPPEVVLGLLEISQVVGVKFALPDAAKFLETVKLLRAAPRQIAILTGADTFILESLLLGADGALIGFGTVATRLQVEMLEAVRAREFDRAVSLWERLKPLVDVIFAPPARDYRARLKEALVLLGVIKDATVRPPLVPISREDRVRIRLALVAAGLL